MGRLMTLKRYNEVTEGVRLEFYRTKELADRTFYEAVHSSAPLEMVVELLKKRDAAITTAWKKRKLMADAAWAAHKWSPYHKVSPPSVPYSDETP